MVIKPILVTIMENFAYPKTWLTPKLKVDITVRVVKQSTKKKLHLECDVLMPTLKYCTFFPFHFFSGSDFVYSNFVRGLPVS